MAQCGLQIAILLAVCKYCLGEAHIIYIGNCPLVAGGTCPDPSVGFILYTRTNPTAGESIEVNKIPSALNSSHPTKVLVHGYNSGMDVLFGIRDAYLAHGDYNVIMMDWNKLCPGPCYPTAVFNARFAGKCSAQIVQNLRKNGLEDIHLVGFSLGAHVTGFTANNLKPYKLPRITGLDPAMPLFVAVPKDAKLDAGDAKFVDVMHTNSFFQGKAEQMGHVDVYMNGGVNQPGCVADPSPLGCDHHRAVAYFSESILSKIGFWAWKCKGLFHYAIGLCPPKGKPESIGEFVDRSAKGLHICKTNAHPPYAEGKWSSNEINENHNESSEDTCSFLTAMWDNPPQVLKV